ncbi:uncharacterized protein N7484_010176 [Penicillium longicatenatum]|uniref:uncharacterized protein n=1 Tax=Penicillium longicatenatum TaxID=1561947 RepID=UPI00254829A7|nr:uncharacterized protein N7484_010176 [Penicillium longicatenatum]KAJ5636863.1 hypothetical protein N7484_010176 [Penicillium longicatenatum]KAJ5657051.1 hypothetical protein N7507_009001 [Penicillium longicatenatum]
MSEKPEIAPIQGDAAPEGALANTLKEKSEGHLADPGVLNALDEPHRIQQIIQEGLLLAGGAAAILLQVAEPGVGKGVHKHSDFASRPLDRLRTTMTYIYCMTYGTRDEKKAIIEMVHRVHAPVSGPDYSANDPELQLWVAATLYAVGTDLYQRVFGNMDQETSDAIYHEYSILATSLRVPPGMWPPSRLAFWQYWDAKIATVEITDDAKHVVEDLLRNKKLPIPMRAVLPLVRLTTTEMLPPRIREAYGLKSTKIRRGSYRFLMGFTRVTYPHLPRVIRTYPMRYYLKDMRRRLSQMA